MKKEKKVKKAYKYLREQEVESLQKMSNQELLKEFLTANKAIKMIDTQKKQDSDIENLKKQIKEHREKNTDEKTAEQLRSLKEEIREIKEEIDKGAEELISELKEINKDYREDKGYSKEKLKLIQRLLDSREMK